MKGEVGLGAREAKGWLQKTACAFVRLHVFTSPFSAPTGSGQGGEGGSGVAVAETAQERTRRMAAERQRRHRAKQTPEQKEKGRQQSRLYQRQKRQK